MWSAREPGRGKRAALTELVEQAARTGDYRTPWVRSPRIWAHFADEDEILRHLQRQWSTELGGAMFAAIDDGTGDLAEDVAIAYFDTLARMHSTYKILQTNAEHRAIAAERRKEDTLLKTAGLRFPRLVA